MLLIVVATPPEAQAFSHIPQSRVIVSGVGATSAALATWRALSAQNLTPPSVIVSAGIAGAYDGVEITRAVVSNQIIQADLGVEHEPFLTLQDIGLSIHPTREQQPVFDSWTGSAALAQQTSAIYGNILTLNTVTGSHERAQWLQSRWNAVAEGMEGAGVAQAAALAGIPMLEVRGISNRVGPRDRAGWKIPEALIAARQVLEKLAHII